MSTDKLLVINGNDLSDVIEENSLRIKYTPVYDEHSAFTAMDGSVNRTLLGFRADISAEFSGLDDERAAALSGLLSEEKYAVSFAFPDVKSADFRTVSLAMEPERIAGDMGYWSAFLSMQSDIIPADGL
ncbi:MAG: hypothetical protein ACI4XF_02560 [Oscillospiraceae bacterium]